MDRKHPILINRRILKNRMKKHLKAVGGHTPKAFAVFHESVNGVRNYSSLFFGDLIRKLLSGDSSYDVYFYNQTFAKNKKEIDIPSKIRCIVKEMPSQHIPYYNEVVGSRLANLLGVPVAYNMAYQKEFNPNFTDQPYDYLISVDYLPDKCTEYTLSECGVHFDSYEDDVPLSIIMENITTVLTHLSEEGKILPNPEYAQEFLEDFALQHLFKNLLCEDEDYCARNATIIIDQYGRYRLGPCFDMELFFQGCRGGKLYDDVAKKDIEYLHKKMPHVVKGFLQRCSTALKRGKIDAVMDESIKTSDRGQHSKEIVKKNIFRMTTIYTRIKSENQMENV